MFQKKDTQKQKAYNFYNSYKWNKVTRPTFYYRVRLGWEETREDKIRVKDKNHYIRRDYKPKGKRAMEMTWYNKQPEPKASKTLFRNRLNGGYAKEEAILIGDAWFSVRKWRKEISPQQYKPYVPIKKEIKKVDERDFKIEITYPKEVAKIFRKEYQKMIDDIEWELTYTEEKTQIAEMNEKLIRLQWELEIFNSYNRK